MTNQFFAVLDEDTEELVHKLSSEAGVSPDGIVSRVFAASMPQLSEYLTWMLTLEKGSDLHQRGKNLLVSYGPEDLLTGIRKLDPEFKSSAERLADEIREGPTKRLDNLKGTPV